MSSSPANHAGAASLRVLLEVAGVVGAATLLVGAALTANLVAHDPGVFSGGQLAELALAVGWICFALNACFSAVLLGVHAALRRLSPAFRCSRLAFLLAGLPALHLAWVLLNRLPKVQLLFFEPVFVTPDGLGQTGLIALASVGLGSAVLAFGRRAPVAGIVSTAAAVLLVVGVLEWNGREERAFRTYSMERVRSAAALALQAAPAPPAASDPTPTAGAQPVIVLALDGWGWDVIVPLLEAGRLPNTAALIAQGAIGYLDNGDDSFSPRIWNTVFTGRDAAEHGVHDFFALRLPRSGRTLPDLVSQTPAIDSFYGFKQLARKLPSLGLWELVSTSSHDVAVKPVWSVASEHGRRVVVVNVLNTVPATPVNGAMVSLQRGGAGIAADDFHPEELANRWQPHPTGKRSVSDWGDALSRETAFTLSLFRENAVALGIYYTNAVDRLAHKNWNFHAREQWLVTKLPDALPDAEWESLVVRHADDSFLAAYAEIDAQIDRFLAAHPDATYVVLSDHGWTFSGYSHYGSQDGIVIVSGPRARSGTTISSVHIRDVAPTLLALLGVPLSDELSGRVVAEALAETPQVARVASYGAPGARETSAAPLLDDEALKELIALGYAQ
jgi:predicted AlkP superfamily phosphohydrolase/phosphomutase